MKLIIGLGNPGVKYSNTRHNIGFMTLDIISKKLNESFDKEKFQGAYFKTKINNNDIIFLKPLKYMNLSGEVVRDFVQFYKIDIKDILIICDDLDMNLGKIRLRAKGTSGGHNGLKNIFDMLGTNQIQRLKIGISNNKNMNTKDYVLGKFNKEDEILIYKKVEIASQIVLEWLDNDITYLMSKYN